MYDEQLEEQSNEAFQARCSSRKYDNTDSDCDADNEFDESYSLVSETGMQQERMEWRQQGAKNEVSSEEFH